MIVCAKSGVVDLALLNLANGGSREDICVLYRLKLNCENKIKTLPYHTVVCKYSGTNECLYKCVRLGAICF